MGRKSSLTPEQWAQIEHRYIVLGESVNSLSKEFKINESSIRRQMQGKQNDSGPIRDQLHDLAARKVQAEKAIKEVDKEFKALPVVRQMIVTDLAQKLNSISTHLASSAEHMASTSHRLSVLMRDQVDKIDDVDPVGKSAGALATVATLTRMANEAATIPLNLLKANQEAMNAMAKPQEEAVAAGLEHFYGG